MTLVDTNVLSDVLTADPRWLRWSIDQLHTCAQQGPLLIGEAVYAEMGARAKTPDELHGWVTAFGVSLSRIPEEGLYLAGQAFARYRRSGGVRTGVLPDFFIGAHAQVLGLPILTRDAARYRTYFPAVKLIAPD